jgi:hypothetical protein
MSAPVSDDMLVSATLQDEYGRHQHWVQPHISILNSTYESSDVGRHRYLCGFERNEDAPEDGTQWVRDKIGHFSSPLTLL